MAAATPTGTTKILPTRTTLQWSGKIELNDHVCSRTRGKCAVCPNRAVAACGGCGLADSRRRPYDAQKARTGRPPDGFCHAHVPLRPVHAGLDVHAAEWRSVDDSHQ